MRFLASSGLNTVILTVDTRVCFHVLSKSTLTTRPVVCGYTISVLTKRECINNIGKPGPGSHTAFPFSVVSLSLRRLFGQGCQSSLHYRIYSDTTAPISRPVPRFLCAVFHLPDRCLCWIGLLSPVNLHPY